MLNYDAVEELVQEATMLGKSISELVLADQAAQLERPVEDIYREMAESFKVMQEAIASGMEANLKSASGLSGGNADKLRKAMEEGRTLGGKVLDTALANALAVAELNACMGKIVAAPTAGSCGIIPAALVSVMEDKNIAEHEVVMSLFAAAGLGMVIAKKASISGAEGGCQAECGSAAAMAAGALVEMAGGTPEMVANACGMALKNILGLVCDPVAGLVEVPCVKRNAMGAANALVAADLALAGIQSTIPVDEVISAMKAVGQALPYSLKETARGGLADTPTGRRIAQAGAKASAEN